MSINTKLAEEDRRIKAKNLRYRRAICTELNLDHINNTLYDIMSASADIHWYYGANEETLADLLGDEEEAFELRMAFSSLEADASRMLEDLGNEWVPEFFDCFFGSIAGGRFGGMIGYDSFEGDYFGLNSSWEEEYAQKECRERLKRHTKEEIIDAYDICFRVAVNYISIATRFEGLKSYFDILNGQNTGFLAVVKKIEKLYEKAVDSDRYSDWLEFDSLVGEMPDDVWAQ